MKKVFIAILLSCLTVSTLLADKTSSETLKGTEFEGLWGDEVNSVDRQSWLFECTQNELAEITGKRYFRVAGNDQFPEIFADTKTVKIDRNKKTIKVWTFWVASKESTQAQKQKLGSYGHYKYGYGKYLYLIDYSGLQSSLKSYSTYNCDGSVIESYQGNGSWENIVPGSVMEGIMEVIIKKYRL